MVKRACSQVSGGWRVLVVVFCVFASGPGMAEERDRSPIGMRVEDFTLQDYRGHEHSLSDFADRQLVVIAFLGTDCPLAKLYSPRLAQLAERFGLRGVGFIGVNANRQDSVTEIAAHARIHQIGFPVLKDLGNQLADRLGAVRTPEVFVLDAQRTLQYWGRIDDQYGVGYVRDHAARKDLEIALEELLAGKSVTVAVTESVGCLIGRVRQPEDDADVTYSNQIARILQTRCVECHRDGQIAPFALTEYEEVAGWADMIQEVVRDGRMPPWHADSKYGPFENDRSMSEDEKELIYAWVRSGAPQGDPDDLPEPRRWPEGWQLPRQPDFVAFITEQPFRVPAQGEVRYQYFELDPGFDEDKWVSAVEIQPGNRAVVHHVLMFAGSREDIRDRFAGGARSHHGAYVPGQRVRPYPDGMAKRIQAGSKLIFQIHYTPIGSEQLDRSRVGMTFVDPETVQYEVQTSSAVNSRLEIPPFQYAYRAEASSPRLPSDALLLALSPHMHLRGKSFFYEAVLPDGTRQPLLEVPHYDFNWQTAYRYTDPLPVPEGSRMHCVAHFDNSEDNLSNPDPSVTVGWGEQTWDEMMIGYFDYAVPAGTADELTRRDPVRVQAEELFDRLDQDADGRIDRQEVPGRFGAFFDQIDQDGDGLLSLEELTTVLRLHPVRDR